MKVLLVSGWCSDCADHCLCCSARAEGIDQRLLERDLHRDLLVRLNDGDRVPVVLFLAEDFELCGSVQGPYLAPLLMDCHD
jgi:hypothetical protein